MTDKYGFNEGASIPPDAEATREIYVQAINALAEQYGSQVRVFSYDRSGMHNYLMIVRISAQDYQTGLQDVQTWIKAEIPESDEAFNQALEMAREMRLDDYIRSRVTVQRRIFNKDLQKILKDIKTQAAIKDLMQQDAGRSSP